jgi:P4 family phage/plasmid primase-like protien
VSGRVKEWDKIIDFYVNDMGWNLLPVPKNKKAYMKKWKEYQKKPFPIEILKKHDGNLAVVQGTISRNLIKLDFDIHSHNEYTTIQLHEEIIKKAPELKECLSIQSQSGAVHVGVTLENMKIYEKLPRKMGIWSKIPGIKEVDIKGEGGLAIIPPSQINGRMYKFLQVKSFEELKNKKIPCFNQEEFMKIYKKITCLDFQIKVLKDLKHKAHRAIARGDIQISKYAEGSPKSDEFNYWYAFELDCIHIGLTNEDILFVLRRSQQNYKEHKVLGDLKYLRGKERPPYKIQTLNEMYPEKEYQTSFVSKKEIQQYNQFDPQLQELYYIKTGRKPTYGKDDKFLTKDYIKWIRALQRENETGELDPYSICKEILKTHHILCPMEWKKSILMYEDGVWKEYSSEMIQHIILEYFIEINYYEHASDSEMNQKISITTKFLRKETRCSIHEFDSNPFLLNLMNCIIDISDLNNIKEYVHNHTFKIRRQLPIFYNPTAKCPEIKKMLINIFHQEDIPLIIQKIGLSYTTLMKFQKGTILFGGGNNGKTTFYNFLTNHIGRKNISHIDPIDFKDGFLVSHMESRLANVLSEVNTQEELDITTLKMHIGGEGNFMINKKYEKPYESIPTAKHWYGCNDDFMNIPPNADKGFFRKFDIVECPNCFDGNEDREIEERITTKEEFSGFFNIALKALIKLLKENHFTNSCLALTNWENVKNFWIDRRNPFSMFIKEKCVVGLYADAKIDSTNKYWELKDIVYLNYNAWLKKKGKPPLKSNAQLTGIIKQAGYVDGRRSVDGRQQPIYGGFKILEKINNKIEIDEIEIEEYEY